MAYVTIGDPISRSSSLQFLSTIKLSTFISSMDWTRYRGTLRSGEYNLIVNQGIKFLCDKSKHNLDENTLDSYLRIMKTIIAVLQTGAKHCLSTDSVNEVANFFKEVKA